MKNKVLFHLSGLEGCYKPRKLYISFDIEGYNIKLYRYVAKEGEPFPSFYYVKIEKIWKSM